MKMFEKLVKSKFFNKCKSDLKLTKTRIEIIKKKRNAVERYLRNDIADLLRNGLDMNAYGRAEGLIVEMNRSKCYEFVEQCCEHTLSHLSAIDHERECPEDCRDAVSSLMFAAARFADLPELRQLRTLFSERYGKSLDFYVNKEFSEKLKSGLPSKDTKLQLLQNIAEESGLEWDSKALENKLYNESRDVKNFGNETNDSAYSLPDKMKESLQRQDIKGTEQEHEFQHGRESYFDRKVHPVEDIPQDDVAWRADKHKEAASVRNVAKEDEDEHKPPSKYTSIPPPYTKSEVDKPHGSLRDTRSDTSKETVAAVEQVQEKRVPKSVRRRTNPKPPPVEDTADGSVGSEKEKLEEVNKEKAAQGQRILKFFDRGDRDDDQPDEEEKMMDKLLAYYSRKKGGLHRKGISETVLDLPIQHAPSDSSSATKESSKHGPNRVSSLPVGSTSPAEGTTRHVRASSLQPDLEGKAHVHPKLPEYDDFVARLTALRGNRPH